MKPFTTSQNLQQYLKKVVHRPRSCGNSLFQRTISSQSIPHYDLPSFLEYAHTHSLSPTSTVFVGTYFEYLCAAALRRLSFALTRTGGRSDAGIDLLGTWSLPTLPHPLHVLVQCKALKASVSPEVVRELEGATAGAPEGWRGERIVGVLCAKKPATKGVREAIQRCGTPVVWAMVEDVGAGKARIAQILWNEKVNQVGAQGMAVGLRHTPVGEEERLEKECVLLWKGMPWMPQSKEEG